MQTDNVLEGQRETERQQALRALLTQMFGAMPDRTFDAIAIHVQWQVLQTGDVLMTEGESGDAAFVCTSGRLRVYVRDEEGAQRMVRELGRGEVVGELSLFTGAPRSATVVAIRHSVVARLDKAHFNVLATRNPQISIALTQKIIERLQTQHQRQPVPAPVMVSLLPISSGIDGLDFARKLVAALGVHGRVHLVREADFEGLPEGQVQARLHELESRHDFVLLLASPQTCAWTRTCLAHCDEILLLADATQPAKLHEVEATCLCHEARGRHEVAETLLLLHPASTRMPTGMRTWVERRPVTGHVNLRPDLPADMARLARLIHRSAVGLVLAGGGARGFAHLGVWRALRQRGIEVDCVGGTSMGAVMASVIAADGDTDESLEVIRQTFQINPTGDYNLLPLMSLIKGHRVKRAVRGAIHRLMGDQVDIVDLWKGFFCISSNYSRGCEARLHKGDLGRALLASIAIPGALPPVVMNGELYCDGATFNNFPADVMREMRGVGRIIGVDLGVHNTKPLNFDEVPGSWRLLLDRLRPRSRRRYKLPSLLSYLLNVTILYSISRRPQSRQMTDLYLNPPLQRAGLLEWRRFSSIVRQGEAHANDVLDRLTDTEKTRWGL